MSFTAQPNRRGRNALSLAGALSDAGPLGDNGVDSDNDLGVDDDARAQRFATDLEGNIFRELEAKRPEERRKAISQGLISDPDKPTSLENAIEFRGTCTDMCPLYEQQEREFKKNVHPLEQREGLPGRIDPRKAITMYHRSAAGIDQPLPSDVREPQTLKRTLDHLFHNVLCIPSPETSSLPPTLASLKHTHPFLRDRTRGIRQDFTYQKQWGIKENIECHEKIARFHILSMYELGGLEGGMFLKQEAEQLNKTLISLIELYEDQRLDGQVSPNEPEFRTYQLLSHMHDQEVARSILSLPSSVFNHPSLQLAFSFRTLAQRNFDSQKVGSKSNAEISLNHFTRYFKFLGSGDIPVLVACLAHHKLSEIRRAGVRALMRSYARVQPAHLNSVKVIRTRCMTLETFRGMMGCVDDAEAVRLADTLGIQSVGEELSQSGEILPMGYLISAGAEFNDNADAPPAEKWPQIDSQMHAMTYQQIINGNTRSQKGTPSTLRPTAPTFSPTSNVHQEHKSATFPAEHTARPAVESTPSVASTKQPVQSTAFSWNKPQIPLQTQSPEPSAETAFSMPFKTNPVVLPEIVRTSIPTIISASTPTQQPVGIPDTPSPVDKPQIRMDKPVLSASMPRISAVKRPSSYQMELIEKQLANEMLIEILNQERNRIIVETIAGEKIRRLKQAEKDESRRKEDMLETVSGRLFEGMIAGIYSTVAAEAFVNEQRRRRTLQTIWTTWFAAAKHRRNRRRAKEARQDAFQANIKRLDLGTSRVVPVEEDLGSSLRRSVRKPRNTEPSLGFDSSSVQDTVALLDRKAKQKAIFQEGTFFSLIGNHVCNIESELEVLEESDGDSARNLGYWEVIVDTTNQASGRWLQSKFHLSAEDDRYEASFTGELRESRIAASLLNADSDDPLNESVGLLVFESSSDFEGNTRRYRNLIERIPSRHRYKIGVLWITWDEDVVDAVPLPIEAPFEWHSAICLAKDASDAAFDKSLYDALPEVSEVDVIDFDLQGFLSAISPSWTSLRTLAESILQRKDFTLNLAADVVHTLLRCQRDLQVEMREQILQPLSALSDQSRVLEIVESDRKADLEYPSDLRKELLGLVPLEEDQAPEVISAIDEWKQTEDLEDACIPSIMDLVDRIARAIKDQMLQCSMSLPEGLVEEADRLGDQAVKTSNEVIDRARRTLLSFVPEEKIKKTERAELTPSPNYKPSALERLQAALQQSRPELAAALPIVNGYLAETVFSSRPITTPKKRGAIEPLQEDVSEKRAKLRRLLDASKASMAIV